MEIEQMDVKNAFLHGDLEELYIEQTKGFRKEGREHLVCMPRKSLWIEEGSYVVV